MTSATNVLFDEIDNLVQHMNGLEIQHMDNELIYYQEGSVDPYWWITIKTYDDLVLHHRYLTEPQVNYILANNLSCNELEKYFDEVVKPRLFDRWFDLIHQQDSEAILRQISFS